MFHVIQDLAMLVKTEWLHIKFMGNPGASIFEVFFIAPGTALPTLRKIPGNLHYVKRKLS